MQEFYLIKRNIISVLKRTISFSFVRARTFDRARTFTRTFDRDFVRGEHNDIKYCRRIFYNHAEFFLCSWKKMILNFLLLETKKF